MWIYEKKLEFPVKITKPDARLAKIMIEQYGGAYSVKVYLHKNNRIVLAVLLFVFYESRPFCLMMPLTFFM